MADIALSKLVNNRGLPNLAPDLTWPNDKTSGFGHKTITGINGSAGLVTALSLTGRWLINALSFENMLAESYTVKLTVDGVVIWNAAEVVSGVTTMPLYGVYATSLSNANNEPGFICNASLLLEIQSTTDNNISLLYLARPIL